MSLINTNIPRKNLIISSLFVIISYSITWSILFPLSFVYTKLNIIEREVWHSFGSIGPCIGGIIAIYLLKRKEGLKILKERVTKFAGWKLFLFSFTPLIILLFSLLFESILGFFNLSRFLTENQITDIGSIFIFILPSLCYGFFEEIGWRGFFLPSLQGRFNALSSTLILTIIWWFWHFPAFFYRFDLFFALIFMFPLMLAGSITFTFLFNQSNGSVLMLIIIHISYDIVSAHQISVIATILVSIFYISMTIRVLKLYGIKSLSSMEKVTL